MIKPMKLGKEAKMISGQKERVVLGEAGFSCYETVALPLSYIGLTCYKMPGCNEPVRTDFDNLILAEMHDPTAETESPWVKAPVSNLVRYKPSGVYFARAKVGGKLIRQSLKTDMLSIAKLPLRDLLGKEEQKIVRQKTIEIGKMTLGDALAIYRDRMGKSTEIKPSTRR